MGMKDTVFEYKFIRKSYRIARQSRHFVFEMTFFVFWLLKAKGVLNLPVGLCHLGDLLYGHPSGTRLCLVQAKCKKERQWRHFDGVIYFFNGGYAL